jgi:epoxyqueuosine reductase
MLSGLVIKECALTIGFDLAGIAPIGVWKDLEFFRQWAEKGFSGEMRYLENPKRFDPRLVLPSAKSVICVGLVYNTSLPYSTEAGAASVRRQKSEIRSQSKQLLGGGISEFGDNSASLASGSTGQRTTDDGQPAPRGWISRYAWGHDYHEIMRAKLEQLRAVIKGLAPGVETRVFVDTGPVVERAFARFSGIGWMGKNTCVINQEKGSWFFLGVILTSLELAPDLPAPDRCGSCTACLEACPTEALVEPYVMDASRCISYLTIELKGPIPEQFRPKMGANVFGCDICQDVCPWNSSRQSSVLSFQQAPSRQQQPSDRPYGPRPATTKVPQFHPMSVMLNHPAAGDGGIVKQLATGNERLTTDNERLTTDNGPLTTATASFSLFSPPLDALASFSEDDFRRIFARSPIKRAKYHGWLRNLCVAMGNSGDERFVSWLERAAQHSDPIIREHAAWALGRLRGK